MSLTRIPFRIFLRAVAIGASIAIASSQGSQQPPDASAAGTRKPNILIVLTDDQRASGTFGQMPVVRRWFQQGGTSYENAFAASPACCPSRASIFTGRYVHNHGLEGDYNDVDFADERPTFQSTTIQSQLKARGYKTALFGKYLNGWNITKAPPHFDKWAILDEATYRGGVWNDQGEVGTIATYSTTLVRRRSLRFISSSEKRDRQPWFLVIAPNAPHEPFTPEKPYENAAVSPLPKGPSFLEEDRTDKPDYVQAEETREEDVAREYEGQIRTLLSVDDLVGAVEARLRETGENRRTLAFFTSDNGYLWGEHHLRGKFVPYMGSVRIPLLARWPGKIEMGRTDTRLVSNIDLVPTIQDALNIAPQHTIDGRSLLSNHERERLLIEKFRYGRIMRWDSIITPHFQYIEYLDDDKDEFQITDREYYDLNEDAWQLTNLLRDADPANDPDIGRLSAQLAADRECSGSSCP